MTESASTQSGRRRLKWEPWALMALVLGLGAWLVLGPNPWHGPKPREGARLVEIKIGTSRGFVEVTEGARADPVFRVLLRNGYVSPDFTPEEFRRLFGPDAYTIATSGQSNVLFRLLNITSWVNVIWIGIGLTGQLTFSGRMLLQWLVSEKRRESVVPELFWWLSLAGGTMLFAYFVWRQDIVGVLGQSSGIVIYGRNIRLIYKQRRRLREASVTT